MWRTFLVIAPAVLLAHLSLGAGPGVRDHLTPEQRKGMEAKARELNNQGFTHYQRGEYAEALRCVTEVAAVNRQLYPEERFPQGHPDVALSLNNVGAARRELGRAGEALEHYEKSFAMRQKLYPADRFPQGHPRLASSLNNIAEALRSLGRSREALGYHEKALAMRQQLYPADQSLLGHPEVARSLDGVGSALHTLGRTGEALDHHERALAMRRRLHPAEKFPDGHPDLAISLGNVGSALHTLGRAEEALPHLQRALAMQERLGRRAGPGALGADALDYAAAFPLTLDIYLSAGAGLEGSGPRAYPLVYRLKGLGARAPVGRLLATRVAAGRSDEAKALWADLIRTRLELDASVLRTRFDPAARDKRLGELYEALDKQQRRLAAALPELERLQERDRFGPADLAAALPAGAVFLDLLRYTHVDQGPKKPGETGERRTGKYLAFVLGRGGAAVRVELGPAAEIDAAVDAWRAALRAGADGEAEERGAAARVKALVWGPVAKHLPAETAAVYLSQDGSLGGVPWAALPGRDKGTVLLEQYAVVTVPHGPFLLERLRHPAGNLDPTGAVFAVGGVYYLPPRGGEPAARGANYLEGTAKELARLLDLAGAGRKVTGLDQDRATTDAVKKALPAAHVAHLATHGHFDATGFAREQQRQQEQRGLGGPFTPGGLTARNPLGFVGLRLAGSEAPDAAGPDRGILTGEALLDLDLSKLRLCVLSACETSLGKVEGRGEGVQGLARALHAAGCKDVVASLWEVEDEATAALMAAFYHALWVDKKDPATALREAQLRLYRHPGQIPELATRRGLGAEKPLPRVADPKPGEGERTPTHRWAAFVLSGVGH